MCWRCHKQGRDSLLRPDIVCFGERLTRDAIASIASFIEKAGTQLQILAVGTSGLVYPAAALVDVVRERGGKTWLVNAEPPANAHRFHEVSIGPAGTMLPALLAS